MDRVCLFAQYHPANRVGPHVVGYVAALRACGYRVVVACSGSAAPPAADQEALRATGATVVVRRNGGLDFGAWAELVRAGHAIGADAVLLANDSVFGPFFALGPIVRRMEAEGFDAWGMVESAERCWHLQSWFVQFTRRAFEAPAVARVFAQDFEAMDKEAVIARGELALGQAMQAEGLRCGAVSARRHVSWAGRRRPTNPMHIDWRHHLVRRRLPFLKAEVVRDNPLGIPWVAEWRGVVAGLGGDPGAVDRALFAYTGTGPGAAGDGYPVPVRPVHPVWLGWYVLASRDHWTALRWFVRSLPGHVARRLGRVARRLGFG